MKVLTCINDKNLPPGANVVNGKEYVILHQYPNVFDQIVYIVEGINNEGKTKYGFAWKGYCSTRFADLSNIQIGSLEKKEIQKC